MRPYDILLYLYPKSFRSEYGAEMRHIFTQRRQRISHPVAVIGLWLSTFFEILFNALQVHWDILRQDLHYTVRGLTRSPGFALTAIVVTALGIGANTAVFSIVDHTFIRPLPFPEYHRLVRLWENTPRSDRGSVSAPNYRDWKQMSSSFESMGAYVGDSVTLVGRGNPRRLAGAAVTTGVFAVLGVHPFLGRTFTPDDERAGAPGVVILSHGFWQADFGGDPGILGTDIRFVDATYTVIGVMPSAFSFPTREARFWKPLSYSTIAGTDRGNRILDVVAKLKGTVSIDQARAEMGAITSRLSLAYPKDMENSGATFTSLRDAVSPQSRLLVGALFGASFCVLLIACTNLTSLILTRGFARQKELAVRAAMGAGRERMVRQLLTESLVLAVLGGLAGVLVAIGGLPLMAGLVPAELLIEHAPAIDSRVLVFAALLTCLAGLGFGVLPALRTCSAADSATLRTSSGTGMRRGRLRSLLVAAQVTASIVLLMSSGLLIRALWRIQAIDPGFRTENVVSFNTPLSTPGYDVARRLEFYSRVLPEVRALPGVTNAAFISVLPMVTGGGIQPVNGVTDDGASLRFVSPDFFSSMQIPIRQGRDVSESDTLEAPLVALVSESFVLRHFPGLDPIGQDFDFSGGVRGIVGVVGNIRVRGLERESEPQVYLPYKQMPVRGGAFYSPKELVVRSSIPPNGLIPAIRRIVQEADPELPLQVRSLEDIVTAQTETRVAHVSVIGAFATLSVLLAGIGIHGLLSFAVSQRIPEIGLRMALGATNGDILLMVLRQGLLLTCAGCVLGLILGSAAGWWIQALLAGVDPIDLPSILCAAGLAFVMTLSGSLFPALRAIRVDPITVIRME